MAYRAFKYYIITMSWLSYMIYIELKWIRVEECGGNWVIALYNMGS